MSADARRPEDLETLLGELRRATGEDASQHLLPLMARLHAMSRRHLPQGSALRAGFDSEDLAQEGLLHLVRQVDRFRGDSWPEFLAFVHAILAQKKGQQVRRHRVRRGEFEAATASEHVPAQQATPSIDAMAAEDRRRLRAMVQALPEPYRTTLQLRLEGLDNEALALRLGLSDVALRQRLSRAIKQLRERW